MTLRGLLCEKLAHSQRLNLVTQLLVISCRCTRTNVEWNRLTPSLATYGKEEEDRSLLASFLSLLKDLFCQILTLQFLYCCYIVPQAYRRHNRRDRASCSILLSFSRSKVNASNWLVMLRLRNRARIDFYLHSFKHVKACQTYICNYEAKKALTISCRDTLYLRTFQSQSPRESS